MNNFLQFVGNNIGWIIPVLLVIVFKDALKGVLDKFVEKTGIFGPVGLTVLAIALVAIFKFDALQWAFGPQGPGSAVGANARTESQMFDNAVFPANGDTTNTQNPVYNEYAKGVEAGYELQNAEVATAKKIEDLRLACVSAASDQDSSCLAINRLEQLGAAADAAKVKAVVDQAWGILNQSVAYDWGNSVNGTATGKNGSSSSGNAVKSGSFKTSLIGGVLLLAALGAVFGGLFKKRGWS